MKAQQAVPLTTNERISHLLVALPIAHVLGASLFLASYCFGFGSNLIAHVKITDLFSVSIGDMVKTYVFSLLVPIAFTSFRLTSRFPYAADRAAAVSDPQERAKAQNSNKKIRAGILFIVYGAALIACGFAAYQAATAARINLPALYAGLSPALFATFMLFSERAGLSTIQFEVISTIAVFCGSLFFQGMIAGDADRWRSYEYASKNFTMCDRAAIIRSFSDDFLAVLPGDTKALVSSDCKVKYRIRTPGGETNPATGAAPKPLKSPRVTNSRAVPAVEEKSRAEHKHGLSLRASQPAGSPRD